MEFQVLETLVKLLQNEEEEEELPEQVRIRNIQPKAPTFSNHLTRVTKEYTKPKNVMSQH